MDSSAAVRLLQAGLPDALAWSAAGPLRLSVELRAEDVKAGAAALLRADDARFVTLTAVDTGLDLALLYTFVVGRVLVTLRTELPKETSAIATLVDLAPAAEMIEREVSELFGVQFVGHPREKNLILPDGWAPEAPPLRKPLAGPVLPQARVSLENVLRGAASLRISPAALARREAVGLPTQPPLASSDDAAMREFRELVRRTAFDKRAGYDWTKGRLRYK